MKTILFVSILSAVASVAQAKQRIQPIQAIKVMEEGLALVDSVTNKPIFSGPHVYAQFAFPVPTPYTPTENLGSFSGVYATRQGCEKDAAESHEKSPTDTYLCAYIPLMP